MSEKREALLWAAAEAAKIKEFSSAGRSAPVFEGLGQQYDSPELALERRIFSSGGSPEEEPAGNPAGEIFTLGVLLAEKLTGKLPDASGTAIKSGAPWEFALAEECADFSWNISTGEDNLDAFLASLLSPNPGDRPSAGEAEKTLRELAGPETGKVSLPGPADTGKDLWPGDDWEWDEEAIREAGLTFAGRKEQFGKKGYLFSQEDGSGRFFTPAKLRMMKLIK